MLLKNLRNHQNENLKTFKVKVKNVLHVKNLNIIYKNVFKTDIRINHHYMISKKNYLQLFKKQNKIIIKVFYEQLVIKTTVSYISMTRKIQNDT